MDLALTAGRRSWGGGDRHGVAASAHGCDRGSHDSACGRQEGDADRPAHSHLIAHKKSHQLVAVLFDDILN